MATKPVSMTERARRKANAEHRRKVREAWARRHPLAAAEEHELRRARREREEQFGHKVNGTVETHAKAGVRRQGGMMRLYQSGAITIHQWGASLEIAAAHDRIAADAGLPTSWAIERVDGGRAPHHAFFEALGSVRMEIAYSRWRRQLSRPGPVLAMIAEDCGLVNAARRYSTHVRTMRKLLREALDLWIAEQRKARAEVDEATLAAAQAAIL